MEARQYSIETGMIFFPDLSAWYKIGKSFRIGCGALGVFLPDEYMNANALPFVFYLGAKAAIAFN